MDKVRATEQGDTVRLKAHRILFAEGGGEDSGAAKVRENGRMAVTVFGLAWTGYAMSFYRSWTRCHSAKVFASLHCLIFSLSSSLFTLGFVILGASAFFTVIHVDACDTERGD